MKKIRLPLQKSAVRSLARTLQKKFSAASIYLVGGYVRDLLLGRDSKDIDLVVAGVPAKKLQTFLKSRGSVNLVGRHFGVFKFVPKKTSLPAIDIALPRTEHAWGTGGYRDVKVQSNWQLPIEEDLGRRDFTVNAMAWDILQNKLIDPFHGQKDLRKKIIRAVGKPLVRFQEDYSRLLRAVRFACQLNFSIEPKTWKALQGTMPRLNAKKGGQRVVPFEVMAKELLKTFLADPPRALELLDQSGVIRQLIPELLAMKKCPQPSQYHSEGDVWNHTKLALSTLTGKKFEKEFGPANAEIIMAVLFHDLAKPKTITYPKKRGERIRFDGHDAIGAEMTKKIAERLRLSSYKDERIEVDADRLANLVRAHLLLISGRPSAMRATTIERYYLRDQLLGHELLALQFADGSATLDRQGKPALREYRAMRQRIRALLNRRTRHLPPPLLDGHEIMRLLKLRPGPEVGAAIEQLREAQLQGDIQTKLQARTFVKKTDKKI
ncbi:CCA tRNA nucleotidyltransferase [Candidatus Uhrbacteria bacterium]|nr:CCA tRNA nucleotidyltransferase [Candidatus Uhrbacteria bacterium]